MTWSITHKRRKRALNTLERGIFATGLGVFFLLAPSFSGSSPVLETVAAGLHVPGWFALGLGLALMAGHFALKVKTEKTPIPPALVPNRRAPTTPKRTRPERSNHWNPEVFAAIEWRRFEAVCEALFTEAGFTTRSQSRAAMGGLDLWLHAANAAEPVAVVRCQHWPARPVGLQEMREFLAVMTSHQLQRGSYATPSAYTAEARQFAKDNGIQALDGSDLLGLIAQRTPEQQQALLAIAYEGEYWRPTCARCGIKLVEYAPPQGGAAFWACSNYLRCNSLLPMTAALR